MEHLLPKPREMDFNAPNLAATWKKWKQNMEFYLTAMMKGKTEEEKYSVFLFLIGEQGRDVFNTMQWEKKRDEEGNPTDEDEITVKQLFQKFEEYCLPKKNLVVERRKFFWRNQQDDETFDQYMTELKNLASTCEFGELHDGLLTYKIVDGIRSEKVRDVLLRKGAEMTLAKAINICRTDEITKLQMKEMSGDREVNVIKKKYGKTSRHKNQGGPNQMSKMIRNLVQIKTAKGRNKSFVDGFINRENVLHMGRNVTSARRRITGRIAVRQRRFMKHQLHHQQIL